MCEALVERCADVTAPLGARCDVAVVAELVEGLAAVLGRWLGCRDEVGAEVGAGVGVDVEVHAADTRTTQSVTVNRCLGMPRSLHLIGPRPVRRREISRSSARRSMPCREAVGDPHAESRAGSTAGSIWP